MRGPLLTVVKGCGFCNKYNMEGRRDVILITNREKTR